MTDQADSLRRVASHHLAGRPLPGGRHHCRVLAVTGGKGGVGKTNVAVNLSLALCEGGARVLLLDGDMGLANVDLLLGLSPQYTLQHVFDRQVGIEDIVVEGPLGLHVLPGGMGLPELANLNTLDIVRLLGLLRSLERDHDVLVIDTAAGIGQVVTRLALAADDVLIVSTPEPTSMVDAYGLIKALKQGDPACRLHLVVNMVRQRGEDTQFHKSLAAVALSYLGMELNWLGSIPRDEAIVTGVKNHTPFFISRPQSVAAKELRRIAGLFLADLSIERPDRPGGFFARLINSMR